MKESIFESLHNKSDQIMIDFVEILSENIEREMLWPILIVDSIILFFMYL